MIPIRQTQELINRLRRLKADCLSQARSFTVVSKNPMFNAEEREIFHSHASDLTAWAYSLQLQIDQETKALEDREQLTAAG